MILPVEAWMDLRRYKPLRDAGATWREIADEVAPLPTGRQLTHERPEHLTGRGPAGIR